MLKKNKKIVEKGGKNLMNYFTATLAGDGKVFLQKTSVYVKYTQIYTKLHKNIKFSLNLNCQEKQHKKKQSLRSPPKITTKTTT